jgi:FKBP12-rapamycin complex-associated protein
MNRRRSDQGLALSPLCLFFPSLSLTLPYHDSHLDCRWGKPPVVEGGFGIQMPVPGAAPVMAGGPSNLSALSASSVELLGKLFVHLKSRDESTRALAARELGLHVANVTAELKGDSISSFNSELNRLIFGLTHSPHTNEKLGGIVAIEVLTEQESEDNSAKLYRFYQYLKPNLPCNDATVMIAASRALGKVCKQGAQSLGDQFMEFEVLRALDYLQGE